MRRLYTRAESSALFSGRLGLGEIRAQKGNVVLAARKPLAKGLGPRRGRLWQTHPEQGPYLTLWHCIDILAIFPSLSLPHPMRRDSWTFPPEPSYYRHGSPHLAFVFLNSGVMISYGSSRVHRAKAQVLDQARSSNSTLNSLVVPHRPLFSGVCTSLRLTVLICKMDTGVGSAS